MYNSFDTFPEPEANRFERLILEPIERVRDYLAKLELKEKWLAAGCVELLAAG